MLPKNVLQFLSKLEKNNDRSWFEANRPQYEAAKADFLNVVEKLIPAIAAFDPSIGELQAKNCTFRINRDVRFSKNKAPYKNNMSAYFNREGKKGTGAGYYFHVQPGMSFLAAGIWQPEPAHLASIRQEIDYNYAEWKKITGSAKFKKIFPNGLDKTDTLVRPPKGYAEDNAATEILKLKSYVGRRALPDEMVHNKTLIKEVAAGFAAIKPVIDFLNRALD